MSNPLDQYDPFLIEIGKMLDPGRWWSEGPTGYVASMYDSRSFEDRSIAAVKNAERLVLHIAGEIANEAALPSQLESAINVRISVALEQEAEKRAEQMAHQFLALKEAPLLEQIEDLKRQLEEARQSKSASSFLDLAGDGDDIFEETPDVPYGSANPLLNDLVRAAPLPPRRDVDLVNVGPEQVAPKPPEKLIDMNKNFLANQAAVEADKAPLHLLVEALRRAQYTAEPIAFEINTTIRVTPEANKDDSIATIDLTVEQNRVTRETTWVNPDRPTEKYDQVFAIVQSAAKDAGRHITKLTS